MEIIYLSGQKINIKEPICSAIGFFDGLHLGHMALVHKVQDISQEKGYKKALMTFDHHPLYVLGKIKEEKYMTSMEDRIHLLEKESIDYLFIIQFTQDVAHLSPQDFINHYLLNTSIQHVVCGFDFRFGNMNSGDAHTLQSCLDLDVTVIDEVIYQGEKISSSRMRKVLETGDIQQMNHLLGRHYCITGKVIKGKQIGHSIGFPTANVDYQGYFLPRNGVYVTKLYVDKEVYMGMCNIGYNPTFTALEVPSLEVYILDFDRDIYGCQVKVEFYEMIRQEHSFASKEGLIQQLTHDQNYVRNYFQNLV